MYLLIRSVELLYKRNITLVNVRYCYLSTALSPMQQNHRREIYSLISHLQANSHCTDKRQQTSLLEFVGSAFYPLALVGVSLLNHHQCAASTWMMRRLPQDNDASALTSHQLQVKRRESQRQSSVCSHHTPATGGEERESETIKCMRSPHTSYRWRGERVIEPIK